MATEMTHLRPGGKVAGSVADDAIGKAAGANSMMRELGSVFGIAATVAVFAGAGSYGSAEAFTDGPPYAVRPRARGAGARNRGPLLSSESQPRTAVPTASRSALRL